MPSGRIALTAFSKYFASPAILDHQVVEAVANSPHDIPVRPAGVLTNTVSLSQSLAKNSLASMDPTAVGEHDVLAGLALQDVLHHLLLLVRVRVLHRVEPANDAVTLSKSASTARSASICTAPVSCGLLRCLEPGDDLGFDLGRALPLAFPSVLPNLRVELLPGLRPFPSSLYP